MAALEGRSVLERGGFPVYTSSAGGGGGRWRLTGATSTGGRPADPFTREERALLHLALESLYCPDPRASRALSAKLRGGAIRPTIRPVGRRNATGTSMRIRVFPSTRRRRAAMASLWYVPPDVDERAARSTHPQPRRPDGS